ncbi:MAG TPA: UDP-N-acetylmuramoyl-tripeptide--D-alanyl-D-alanine ligase [Polyangiaceae bacterium]|nr:UDP-N-acetylmuramoyl-tripeptide--D-alanyl-D-alanine ligase [Polyangiaceae bacterium]
MATPIPGNAAALTAWSAAAATGGHVVHVRGDGAATRGITSDSRAASRGCAFVALRGERHDGHDHVEAAIRGGAELVVVERGRAPAVVAAGSADVVEVDDTLAAWGDLAAAHVRAWRRGRADARVFAITGSAGKTTTKELCAALLQSVAPCHATTGNLNNRVGVPAVAFGLQAHHRFAVFEVGMSVRGEIAALARILEPDVAILTNVGVAHAEGVGGTRADVAREKGDLFAALPREGVAVACLDDPAATGQLARTRARHARTFGAGDDADYQLVERASASVGGARVRIRRRREITEAQAWLPLLGEAAAVDLTGALAAVEFVVGPLGDDVLAAALREPRFRRGAGVGRMQVRHLADGTLVLDDTYNANPQSVRAALHTLREIALAQHAQRAVVVLGEMRELGPAGAQEHASLGDAIALAGAKLALSCGGMADLAVQGAERAGVTVAHAADAEEASRVAVARVEPGDVVLVKASRSVGAERVVEALVRARGEMDPGPTSSRPSTPPTAPSAPVLGGR